MNQLVQTGRIIFALGVAALGVLCFIQNDFIVGRPPAWPAGWGINPFLAYFSGVLLIVAAAAVLFQKSAGRAALAIATLILLLSVFRHLPQFTKDWLNALKTLALLGGTLIVAASFFRENPHLTSRTQVDENRIGRMILTGCIFLSAFFIASGYAHFKFAGFVENFIPSYIPFRVFWTYFCGICLIAGGAGLLIPQTRYWAALLSGIMIGGWFLMLHFPRFLANMNDVSDRLGLCESFTFVGMLWVLAGVVSRCGE